MRDNLRRHTVNEPLPALAERNAEIAKLRAAVETASGVVVSGALKLIEARAEIAKLRAGITAAAAGDYPMPVGERWRADGQPSNHDRCVHGAWMYEGCAECLSDHLLALLDPPPAPDGGEG